MCVCNQCSQMAYKQFLKNKKIKLNEIKWLKKHFILVCLLKCADD